MKIDDAEIKYNVTLFDYYLYNNNNGSLYKPFFFIALAFSLTITTLPLLHALHHDQIDHPTVEAIYQFGDSISDTGNLIRDNPIGEHSNFARLPYGQTFFHKPTGRCSNGRLMIDFFGMLLIIEFTSIFDFNFLLLFMLVCMRIYMIIFVQSYKQLINKDAKKEISCMHNFIELIVF
ncbi:hypothetical protein RDABS01_000780 [Bienertia sinuspersici]